MYLDFIKSPYPLTLYSKRIGITGYFSVDSLSTNDTGTTMGCPVSVLLSIRFIRFSTALNAIVSVSCLIEESVGVE